MSDFIDIQHDRKSFFLIVIILALLAVIFYSYVYLPQRIDIRQKQTEYSLRQAELLKLEKYYRAHTDQNRYENELLARLNNSRAMIPEALDLNEFINELQMLARQNMITVKGISPEQPVNSGDYVVQDIKVEFLGDYQSVLCFLADVEQQKRFVNLLDITAKTDKQGKIGLAMKLRLYAWAIE